MPIIFPDVEENSKIDTKKFLLASDELIDSLEKFGRVFAQFANDMRNNVKKTYSVYHKDVEANKYLQDLILLEKSRNEEYAIDALLWLKRALYFTLRLFELIEVEYVAGNLDENIAELVKTAYTESLEKHHNWAAKKLFQLVYRLSPNKSTIIDILGIENNEVIIKRELKEFNTHLRICIMNLHEFYEINGLENINVVE